MKLFLFFLSVYICTFISMFAYAQPLSEVDVKFLDGKIYYAAELGRTANTLKVQFVHSGAVYEFDNTGTILKSSGAYRVGEKVQCILPFKRLNSIYNEVTITGIKLGVVFGDGKVYYGYNQSVKGGSFIISFSHSDSKYTLVKDGSVWKVKSSDKGAYPPGHILKDIFEVETIPEAVFYGDCGKFKN